MKKIFQVTLLLLGISFFWVLPVFGQADSTWYTAIDMIRDLLAGGVKVDTVELFNQYVVWATVILTSLSTALTHYWGWWRNSGLDGSLRYLAILLVFILLLAAGRLDMDFNSIIKILGASGFIQALYAIIKNFTGLGNKSLEKK